MKQIYLWTQFFKFSLSQIVVYRADIILRLFGMILMVGVMVFVLTLPYQYVDELAGWTRPEMIIVLGFYYMSNGLAWMLFKESLSNFDERVRMGTLDNILVKPVNSMFMVSFFDIDVSRFADFLVGLILVVIQVVGTGMEVPVQVVLASAVAFIAGLAIVYSIYLMINTLSFWTTETHLEHVANPLFIVSKYPADIWGKYSVILYWIVPMAFMSTVPAGILIGKFSLWWAVAGVALGIGWVTAAAVFWKIAIRNYAGVGS
jgi:ABC-2 type transport system permease protein